MDILSKTAVGSVEDTEFLKNAFAGADAVDGTTLPYCQKV